MGEYKGICGAKVYHWVWMNTHYHMIGEVVFENLRPFIAGIQQAYGQYHHRRHGGSGTFRQRRFKSKPVEIGEYLVRCGRYIERNPVRAGITLQAWQYKWSSAAFYVKSIGDEVTDLDVYVAGDRMSKRDQSMYGEELMATTDEEWMRQQGRRRVLGSARFEGQLKVESGRYRRRRGRPVKGV